MSHKYAQDFLELRQHYAHLLTQHGQTPQAVQYSDLASLEARMRILCEVGDMTTAKVLDFGCGYGQLLDHLLRNGFRGSYVGYDICPEMIQAAASRHSNARFEIRDIFTNSPEESFDYVIINGVFNNLFPDNLGFISDTLRILYRQTNRALAFNLMSRYVDYYDDNLYYADPEEIFAFCKTNLSPCVTLRHDYCVKPDVLPFEFAIYIHKTETTPRKKLPQPDATHPSSAEDTRRRP